MCVYVLLAWNEADIRWRRAVPRTWFDSLGAANSREFLQQVGDAHTVRPARAQLLKEVRTGARGFPRAPFVSSCPRLRRVAGQRPARSRNCTRGA